MNYKTTAKQNLQNKWGISIVGMIILFAAESASNFLSILILPINVGYARLHTNITKKDPEKIEDLIVGFSNNYLGNLVALLLRIILVLLWMLLLIIPGIIKSMAYALTEYILQDDDFKEDGFEALKLSEKMMSGHKAELFWLLLSFIGWILLVPFTLGLLLFYVVPYISQTMSVYYQERKKEYLGVHREYHYDPFENQPKKNKEDDFFYE